MLDNFISTVWSETLLTQLDREYIGVKNCNREFEGEIKNKGCTVKIGSIGNINVFDYVRNTDMSAPQNLSDKETTLDIVRAMAFNFQIDDIDRVQSQPKLMKAAMAQAAAALADEADKYVYEVFTQATAANVLSYEDVTPDNILDMVVAARQKLLVNGVNSNIKTSLEVTPEVAAILLRSKILSATDNSESLENGLLGKLIGFDVYVSPNVVNASGRHKCLARTKRAVAFADQLNEVEAYRPESRFADAVKGLHLYGSKLVYPDELIVLDIGM